MSSMNRTQDWLSSFRQNSLQHSASSTLARTISVTAGKGGVGKTSVALKISLELARLGRKVLLLDCDYNLSNTLIKLGLPLSDNFYSLISGEKSFDECLYKSGNFHLLSGCNGNIDLLEKQLNFSQLVVDIISGHEKEYDFIIMDCPAGLSSTTLSINAYCHDRFVVVTPDKSSLTDSYSLIKVLKAKYATAENHLIVNKVSSIPQYHRVVKTMGETVEHFLGCRTICLGGIRAYLGGIDSFDEALINCADAGVHKNFLKVLENYTEKFLGQTVHARALAAAGIPSGQEVRSL